MRPSWLALKLAVVSVNRQCHLALMNVFAARQAASQIPPAVGLSLQHFVAGPGRLSPWPVHDSPERLKIRSLAAFRAEGRRFHSREFFRFLKRLKEVRVRSRSPLQQLGIPVGSVYRVQVGQPLLVALEAERLQHEWRPLRPKRLADQMHTGLLRQPSPLDPITRKARTDHVLPGREPSA